jgi:tryptophanyl-tRNA synthetase
MNKPVILTGIRANNDLHIGNYFGAMLPLIDMAKERSSDYQINLFIPDLHSFTTPIDHSLLLEQIFHNARIFIAAGLPINNDSINLYRQSYISSHSELAVILNSFTGMGEMSRMIQFKDKSVGLGDDRTSVGLFDYPVLMASDILLYNAKYIPVGDDQSQHLEFTRDIAERMNNKFGEIFTIPEAVKDQHAFFGKDQGLRIKDLVDPIKKMSKSDETGKGIIFLGDSPEEARKKIMSATTDDLANVHYDPQTQPGISNLLQILSLFQGQTLEEVTAKYEGMTRYGEFKTVVADAVADFLTDFQSKLSQVDDNVVNTMLEKSESAMNEIAKATLLRAQQAVGLRPKAN